MYMHVVKSKLSRCNSSVAWKLLGAIMYAYICICIYDE